MKNRRRAFTLVELLIVMVVISILATIAIVAYGPWRHQTDETLVRNDLTQATSGLGSFMNFHGNYPPNLAGIDFSSSQDIALTLYTNAPFIGVYQNLTADQNAQLFLNACNANLNGLYNTVCTFAGNGVGAKVHVKGTNSTNTVWPSPINQSDIQLPGGGAYDAATAAIISQFQDQGGGFPVYVSGSSVSLPAPTLQPNGPASDYCLEGRAGNFPDIVYHTTPRNATPTVGACPSNPNLHYYQ